MTIEEAKAIVVKLRDQVTSMKTWGDTADVDMLQVQVKMLVIMLEKIVDIMERQLPAEAAP